MSSLNWKSTASYNYLSCELRRVWLTFFKGSGNRFRHKIIRELSTNFNSFFFLCNVWTFFLFNLNATFHKSEELKCIWGKFLRKTFIERRVYNVEWLIHYKKRLFYCIIYLYMCKLIFNNKYTTLYVYATSFHYRKNFTRFVQTYLLQKLGAR